MAETALLERSDPTEKLRKPTIRLTQADIGLMVKLRKEGLTQAQIAQRLDCTQPIVGRWLSQLEDSTDNAKTFLRGQALTMARNIVKKGRAADHVVALKGLGVLEEQQQSGLVVQIGGGSNVQVNVQLGPSPVPRSELP